MRKNRVIFFIHKGVHLLDLAGAVQAFYESETYGVPYEIRYVSDDISQISSSNLGLTNLENFSNLRTEPSDIIIIPGFSLTHLHRTSSDAFYTWLNRANDNNTVICSVCTGAFALAEAGLLNNKTCTTHWKLTNQLQKNYPKLKVLHDRLYVKSGNIYTSAGIATGIDMALFLLEERHGAALAYKVARELVVYIRRDGEESQESIFLQFRQHINHQIHQVQDWIIHNLNQKITIEQLAEMIYTSPRNLTRLFKITTGITIGQYMEKLRVEKAIRLLKKNNKIETIARECGLQSSNQLRSIVKKHTGLLPSVYSALS
jgi:transcriptional regulator GlxA family with amidase domain